MALKPGQPIRRTSLCLQHALGANETDKMGVDKTTRS